jgi:hypothetical protein
MITSQEILSYVPAGGLSEGQTIRCNHTGCATTTSSKSLAITRKANGYVAYCFKCGKSGGTGGPSVVHVQAKASDSNRVKPDRVVPPARATGDLRCFSPEVHEWVSKFLTEQEVKSHGLVCDNTRHRLYVPIAPSGWILRNFKDGPKWYTKVPHGYACYRATSASDIAVVTEDAISAVVCARYVDSYACLGTTVHDPVLAAIQRGKYQKVIVFFDDDNRIVKGKQLQAKRRLELSCPNVVIHRSGGRDPKEHSDAELRKILS